MGHQDAVPKTSETKRSGSRSPHRPSLLKRYGKAASVLLAVWLPALTRSQLWMTDTWYGHTLSVLLAVWLVMLARSQLWMIDTKYEHAVSVLWALWLPGEKPVIKDGYEVWACSVCFVSSLVSCVSEKPLMNDWYVVWACSHCFVSSLVTCVNEKPVMNDWYVVWPCCVCFCQQCPKLC